MVKAGTLRHRVAIEQPPTPAADEYGHNDETRDWIVFATVWAAVVPLSGREFWRAESVQSDLTHTVTTRWLDGVTPQMRVRHNDRLLNIDSVIDVGERRKELQLMCKEAVNG